MATTREEAIVSLGLDTTKLETRMNGFASSFGSKLKGISSAWSQALVAGGIIAGINSLISKFDDLGDKADNLNLSTDFLQGMQHIASQDAVGGVRQFDKAIGELNVRLGAARGGNEQAIASFAKFGITGEDIANLSTDKMFLRIADAVKAIPDPTQRANAAFELLGKSGKNLTGILQEGSAALNERIAATTKLDAVSVAALGRAKAQIEDITNSWTVWLARVLTTITKDIPELLGRMNWKLGSGVGLSDDPGMGRTAAPNAREIAAGREAAHLRRRLHQDERLKEKTDAFQLITDAANLKRKANDDEHAREVERVNKLNTARIEARQKVMQKYRTSINQEFLPELDELATTGIYTKAAQRLQFLMGDAKDAALWGDKSGRSRDLGEIQSIRQKLSSAGVLVDPNQGLIDEIKALPDKILKVNVQNAD